MMTSMLRRLRRSSARHSGPGGGTAGTSAPRSTGTARDLLTRTALPPELIGAALVDELRGITARAGRRRHRGRRRLRLRRTDARHRRPASGRARAGHRLPRRLGDARPRRGRRGRVSTTSASRSPPPNELPGSDVDLITFFDSLHDLGDPEGCAGPRPGRHWPPTASCVLVEPLGADHVRRQLQPGRPDVLRRLDADLHAERRLAADQHVVPAAGHAGRRVRGCATSPHEAGFTSVRRIDVDGRDEPGLGAAALSRRSWRHGRGLVGSLDAHRRRRRARRPALARARSGAGRLVLVSGEPGIGKSALLDAGWPSESAGCTGPARVLLGGRRARHRTGCGPRCSAPPACRPTRARRGGIGCWRPRVHDEVDGAAAAADAQFRLMEAVTGTLARLTADAPVVLSSSTTCSGPTPLRCGCLSFLVRATSTQPLLVRGRLSRHGGDPAASGPEHVGGPQSPLVGTGARRGRDDDGRDRRSIRPASIVEQVWQRSGGNPFFVRELTHWSRHMAPGSPLPSCRTEVVETVRRRLARLPEECVRLMEWAAVAGREIDPELLAACTETDVTIVSDRVGRGRVGGCGGGRRRPAIRPRPLPRGAPRGHGRGPTRAGSPAGRTPPAPAGGTGLGG